MSRKPAITISRLDLERIEALLDRLPPTQAAAIAGLREELDRATVLEPSEMPRNVVTMNSTVSFTGEEGGAPQQLTLVYPNAAGKPGTVSILAPVGSALLGLAKGKHIDWPTPDGRTRRLTVLSIDYQPEAAGDLHR
ncbi:nucleoside diphosphate kinase regulator [Dyella agri]|uniref:Nucleoside diphosphate kinase regulator n=1 Tax=Dyella agri TaxID=1926869 RepID=A0ABW8KNQ4_9GAMM